MNIKATLCMAVSANGYIARSDGSEDFLPYDGWLRMLEDVRKYGHIIWGRQTYEAGREMGRSLCGGYFGYPHYPAVHIPTCDISGECHALGES